MTIVSPHKRPAGTTPPTAERIPPLRHGDHLSRAEFERRYTAMPELKKAELLEGVVFVASPLRYDVHALQHGYINTWVGVYCAATPGVNAGDNATVRLDEKTEVQPDVLLRMETSAGGSSRIEPDGYLAGPPELVVEIAATSALYDMHQKRAIYQRCGVREYLVWRVCDEQIDWWEVRDGVYQPIPADEYDIMSSKTFPGLHLDIPALLRGDMATVLAVVQEGTRTPEHRAFVEQVRAVQGAEA